MAFTSLTKSSKAPGKLNASFFKIFTATGSCKYHSDYCLSKNNEIELVDKYIGFTTLKLRLKIHNSYNFSSQHEATNHLAASGSRPIAFAHHTEAAVT
jgi:hypothetical protein